MRPVKLRIEGFSSYRGRQTIEFDDVDFFSITGPTGAGKSSLIDAMIFALYGRVPRLGARAVAPVITAGADRARVAFDFEADGATYTAVRLAQRNANGGASVREARLQAGEQVLASGADDVTAAVEDLLKLSFDDFTRTVVLPQGEFARFLAATRAERQGLLRNLLGMDVYTRVRELARTRAAVAKERAETSRRSLEALDLADEETRAAAVERRDRLEALNDSMPDRTQTLTDLDAAVAAAESRKTELVAAIDRLKVIEAPPRLGELDELVAEARGRLVDAETAVETAEKLVSETVTALEEMPSVDQLASWNKSRQRLAEIELRLAGDGAAEAARAAEEATTALENGLTQLDEARKAIENAHNEHAAHVLATTLTVGAPCPVCAREVDSIPDRRSPPGLDELGEEESRQSRNVESLRKRAEEARAQEAAVEASRAGLIEQRDILLSELKGSPEPGGLAEIEDTLKRLTGVLKEAQDDLATRETEAKAARKRLEDLSDESRAVSRLLTSAQLKVADLNPPVPESDDFVVQWKELLEWQASTLVSLGDDLKEATRSLEAAKMAAAAGHRDLVENLEGHGVEAREPYAVGVATALQEARSVVAVQEKVAAEVEELSRTAESASKQAAVATALANHLRADGFEQWVMSSALSDLVSGANELLGQLSGGGYSLRSDESGDFSIVDHRNADEVRSVATLSGGETFLVSLALALSLAETLSAKGGAGLDTIILDEGFGTLDDESLDVVASVLEEMTSDGLMVGVITHRKELAERALARYEVHTDSAGAAVRRVSA